LQTGAASERTLQRRVARFDEGMESLFGYEHARRKKLPPTIRRLAVDLKAEHPGFNLNEIANAVYVRFGRRPDHKTIRRVLDEEPIPLRFVRRFPPYREISEVRQRGPGDARARNEEPSVLHRGLSFLMVFFCFALSLY
jgi:hypothetical protein